MLVNPKLFTEATEEENPSLSPAASTEEANHSKPENTRVIQEIATESIIPNRSQPRRVFDNNSLWQLAESIRKHGVLQPITVRKIENNSDFSLFQYELIAGERRLRASRLLGETTIPCIVLDADTQTSAELAIIENLHRDNLNIFEEAAAIASLIDLHSLTQEKIASQLSLTQSAVANKLRLLRLTDAERTVILANNLTERHARALLRIAEPTKRIEALAYIVEKGFNVKQTELYIDSRFCEQTPHEHEQRSYQSLLRSLQGTVNNIRALGHEAKTAQTETDDELIFTITIRKAPLVSRETTPDAECEL